MFQRSRFELMLLVITLIFLCIGAAWGAPNQISYQGRLSDTNGVAINDPAVSMTFAIFDVANGGTALWSESQTVNVQDGIYTVLLGSVGPQALDDSVFTSSNTWLRVTVNGETMTPRQPFASSAYALSAGTVANIQPVEIITQSHLGTSPGQVPQLDASGQLEASLIPTSDIKPKIAYIKDIKTTGTSGGTCTAGIWQTRDLNQLSGDTTFVSLSSNQFTLQSGSYSFEAWVPGFVVNNHMALLYNVTQASNDILGQVSFTNSGAPSLTQSMINGPLSLATATTFEIRQNCATTTNIYGFGYAANFPGVEETYTVVKITKLD